MSATCQVCGKKEKTSVRCSSLSPTSYAYCKSCLELNLEPWSEFVAACFCLDVYSVEDLNRTFKAEFIENMSKTHKKTAKDAVRESIKATKKMYEEWR